ncbi:hypothetical protein F8388_022240 [Cannabis sativa]|uniref:Lon N-terminal domain-containing protein n=1 Tax=Cannabis sativa TaxID=3483 RepID=A0A7J6E7V6_CANSA|nr:hypothetical protein F8388_022240 [Cannabis sativa]
MSSSFLNLTFPFFSNNYPHFAQIQIQTRNHQPLLLRRRRFRGFGFLREAKSSSKRCRLAPAMASSMELPLLPFGLSEVLVPSESKTLHLYEARYLALLEEDTMQLPFHYRSSLPMSLMKKSKLFVHFILDPIMVDEASAEPSFAARYGCLVLIENVEKLDVGALVSIRGVGRIKIVKFAQASKRKIFSDSGNFNHCCIVQAAPFLKGVVIPEKDDDPESLSRLSSKVSEMKEALHSLNSLEIKLKAPKEAPLQTRTANSLAWAEKTPSIDCDEAFIPSLSERLSFAGFQPFDNHRQPGMISLIQHFAKNTKLELIGALTGSTESELLKLQSKKLQAMEVKDTINRLDESLELSKENVSRVAARLAIQSLEIQRDKVMLEV